MSQPKFYRDIELLKVSLLAEEWRGDHQGRIGTYMTAYITLLAVELTTFIGLALSGNLWLGFAEFFTAVFLIGVYFAALFRRAERRYKLKIHEIDKLVKKVQDEEQLGDFDTLMKDETPKHPKGLRKYFDFGLACAALSAILFGVQYILLYFQSVINGSSSAYVASSVKSLSSWVDWTIGVGIAVFFGALMVGVLILVIPWDLLEKTAAMRRGKKLAGL